MKKLALALLALAPLCADARPSSSPRPSSLFPLPSSSFDLDVQVSSGSPLDWLNDLPRPIPTVDRTQLGGDAGRMTMVEEPPHVQATDVFSFARITTVDLIGEIPWTVRDEKGTTPAIYPPPVKDDILWLALGTILRRLLHPAQVNDAEAFEYLTYLGEPSFAAFDMSRSEKSLDFMRAEFRKYVTPIPKEKPEMEAGKDEYETMMLRMTYEDLVAAHPFSFDQKFASRIALLGSEAAPFVIQASKSSHSFLARNAVVMLGRYDDAGSLKRLHELVEKSLDACVRARAVDGIVRRRDNGASELFVEMLRKTRERPFALSLVRGLGILGAKSAAPAIVEFGHLNTDFDSTCTVLTALARLAPDREKESVLKFARSSRSRNFTDPDPQYSPSVADGKETREDIVRQLALLVEAALKEEGAEREILSTVDSARRDLKDLPQNDRQLYRGMLAKFHAPVIYALLQVMGRSDKGRAALLDIAADTREDVVVRVHSLIELARANPPGLKDKMKPFCVLTQDQPVAETGFRILAALDAAGATAAAKALLASYDRKLSLARKSVILVAIRFLGLRKAVDLKRLIEIAELELMAREESKASLGPGKDAPLGSSRRDFSSPVPFLEHLAIEIGRTCDTAAAPILADILGARGCPGRGEAAVGLGSTRSPDGWAPLLKALDDPDPWVRLMSYRSLKYSLGKDATCDWLHASAEERAKAVAQFAAWIEEKKK